MQIDRGTVPFNEYPFIFSGLVTVSAWIDHTDDHYLNYDPYPPFAQFLGWGIELFSVSIVFFYGVLFLGRDQYSEIRKIPKLLKFQIPKSS